MLVSTRAWHGMDSSYCGLDISKWLPPCEVSLLATRGYQWQHLLIIFLSNLLSWPSSPKKAQENLEGLVALLVVPFGNIWVTLAASPSVLWTTSVVLHGATFVVSATSLVIAMVYLVDRLSHHIVWNNF